MVARRRILVATTERGGNGRRETNRNMNQEGIHRMNESKIFESADLPYNNRRRNRELPKSSGRNNTEEINKWKQGG